MKFYILILSLLLLFINNSKSEFTGISIQVESFGCNEIITVNDDACYFHCNSSFSITEYTPAAIYNVTFYVDPMCTISDEWSSFNYATSSSGIFYVGNTSFKRVNQTIPTPTPTPSVPSGLHQYSNSIEVLLCNESISTIVNTCYMQCNSSVMLTEISGAISNYYNLSFYDDPFCASKTQDYDFVCQYPGHSFYVAYLGLFITCKDYQTPSPTSTPTPTPTSTPTPSAPLTIHEYSNSIEIIRCNETINASINTCYIQCNSSITLNEVSDISNHYSLSFYYDPMCLYKSQEYDFFCQFPGDSFYVAYYGLYITCKGNQTTETPTPTLTPTNTPSPSSFLVQINRCNDSIDASFDTCYFQCNSSIVLSEIPGQTNYYNLTFYLDPMCSFKFDDFVFDCQYYGQNYYLPTLGTFITCNSNDTTPTPTPTPTITSSPTPTPNPSVVHDYHFNLRGCNQSINSGMNTCYTQCNSSFIVREVSWESNYYNVSVFLDPFCNFRSNNVFIKCSYSGELFFITNETLAICNGTHTPTPSPTINPNVTITPIPNNSSSSSSSEESEIECDFSVGGILVINSTEAIVCRGVGDTFCRINQHTTCSTDNEDNIGAVKCTTDFGIMECTGNNIKCKSSNVKCSVKPNSQNLFINGIENPSNYYNHKEHSSLFINDQSEKSNSLSIFNNYYLYLSLSTLLILTTLLL